MPATPVGTPRASRPAAAVSAPWRRFLRRAHALALSALILTGGCARGPARAEELADDAIHACRQIVPADAIVRWVEPEARRDRDVLARWCDTIGPILIQPLAVHPPSAAPIDRLALVSWNVHVGGGDIVDLVARLRRGEFTGGTPIDHFILLLQEAYRRDAAVPSLVPRGFPAPGRIAAAVGRAPDIATIAKGLGVSLFYVPAMRNGIAAIDAEDRGNAILSTLDLHDLAVVELPMERQRRAAAVAVVQGSASDESPWLLRVANVHLDTALAILRGGPFAARRRQAFALIEALRTPEDLSTVLAGDFNTWWGASEPALNILRSAFPETPRTPNLKTWSGPLGIHAQLDYIFIRGSFKHVQVQRLQSRFGSDHYPLLAVLEVRSSGDGAATAAMAH
jgi:endonuclease/exonuclease/phosphatase family metal-dependent hydrolase